MLIIIKVLKLVSVKPRFFQRNAVAVDEDAQAHVHERHRLPSFENIPKCEKIVMRGQPLQSKRPVWPALKPLIVSFPFTKLDEARWLHWSLVNDTEVIVGTLDNPFCIVATILH